MRQFFVERPKYLSATSSLSVQQNLVYLDRFMHLSQKLVGVTLIVHKIPKRPKIPMKTYENVT